MPGSSQLDAAARGANHVASILGDPCFAGQNAYVPYATRYPVKLAGGKGKATDALGIPGRKDRSYIDAAHSDNLPTWSTLGSTLEVPLCDGRRYAIVTDREDVRYGRVTTRGRFRDVSFVVQRFG